MSAFESVLNTLQEAAREMHDAGRLETAALDRVHALAERARRRASPLP